MSLTSDKHEISKKSTRYNRQLFFIFSNIQYTNILRKILLEFAHIIDLYLLESFFFMFYAIPGHMTVPYYISQSLALNK